MGSPYLSHVGQLQRALGMHLQVSKSVAIVHEFVRLCNDIAPGSFDVDGRSVDFRRLDSSRIRPVALFGHSEDVWKAMTDVGAAQPSTGSLMSVWA